jgi:hypothetical protein
MNNPNFPGQELGLGRWNMLNYCWGFFQGKTRILFLIVALFPNNISDKILSGFYIYSRSKWVVLFTIIFWILTSYKFLILILKVSYTKNATITDAFTDGYSPSTFYRELKNIYWNCHNHRHLHRRIDSVGIIPRVEKYLLDMPLSPTEYICRYISNEIFFLRTFSVCKTIGKFFFRQT